MKKTIALDDKYEHEIEEYGILVDDLIEKLSSMKKLILEENEELEDVEVEIYEHADYGNCSCGQCGPDSTSIKASYYGIREEREDEKEEREEQERKREIKRQEEEKKKKDEEARKKNEKKEKELQLLKELQEKYNTVDKGE